MAERVLGLEDGRTMAEVLIAYLHRVGHQIELTTDGAEALIQWQPAAPDVSLSWPRRAGPCRSLVSTIEEFAR